MPYDLFQLHTHIILFHLPFFFCSLFLVVIRYFVHLISGSFYSLFHSISLLFMFFVSSTLLLLSFSRCVNFIERQLNSRSWKRKKHFAMMMEKEKRMYWAVWFFIKHEATTTKICWTSQRFHIVHHTHTHIHQKQLQQRKRQRQHKTNNNAHMYKIVISLCCSHFIFPHSGNKYISSYFLECFCGLSPLLVFNLFASSNSI